MDMETETSVNFGAFRLDPHNACLWRGEVMTKLTPKAFAVLSYLIEHPGRIVTKEELFAAVWPETVVSDAALSVCVRELRKELGDDAKTPQYIETVHRRGFRFIAPLSPTQPADSNQYSVVSRQEEGKNTEQAEGLRLQTVGSPPPSPLSLQPEALSLSQDSALGAQNLPSVSPALSRFGRSVVLAAVLLLMATVVIVQYLSRPILDTQDSELGTAPASQALALPDKPSIIVLPFVNLSGDPAQEYFSDGVTEEITATLSRVAGLFVIARTSAFTYKGKAVKVQDISREMGVRYVVEGSALKADGQLRIVVQLIDATTGEHVWAERYNRPLQAQTIFAVQDDITRQIILALRVEIWQAELERVKRIPTDNLNAYDSFLRAKAYISLSTKEAHAQAEQMAERAIQLDPQYAGGYVVLSWVY